MTGRYFVDQFTFLVTTHSDAPLPDQVARGFAVSVASGQVVDPDEVMDALTEHLRSVPHVLDYTYSQFSWGASGGALDFILRVGELVGGVDAVVSLIDRVRQIAQGKGWVIALHDSGQLDAVVDRAERLVARATESNTREIVVTNLEPTPWGHTVVCETPVGRFELDVRSDGITELRRTAPITRPRADPHRRGE